MHALESQIVLTPNRDVQIAHFTGPLSSITQ